MTNQKPVQFIQLLQEISHELNTPKIKWLDIGCGNGNLVYLLNNKNISTFGIDVEFKEGKYVSELLISNKIKQIKSPQNSRSSVINEEGIYTWPIEDDSINFAFSSSVLEHVINPLQFIQENKRILKKGGIALHYLPSKFALIEPHVGVPLGGLIINKIYFKLCCNLNLCFKRYRNKGLDAYDYMLKATNYYNKKTLVKFFTNNGFKYLGDFSEKIPKYLGPRKTKWISRFSLLVFLFSIFRSHIICFKKI